MKFAINRQELACCQTSQLWFACPAEAGQRLECPLRFGLCGHSAALFRFNADGSANIAGFYQETITALTLLEE